MTEIEKMFKTADIKAGDPLKNQKEKAINEVKEWFSSNLNNARVNDDEWRQRGYYTEPYALEAQDLVYALARKKGFY
ncbi:MAG: hypothetical protein I3273_03375 [Candidatus Moeniiplasma glomeromycotorum]|nr:hypothetical protein [Candidatus Moeniiplasma glomeromycotorum]MCE8167742.1 hypothetical protein [Candidatus Moeniiplasma glomeromycotorum]MCE8169142.1 hypothetical protein [Candidatus Moeniiplasma glomeromycotorum]